MENNQENQKFTFQEQYNKVVKAYMENELRPMRSSSCFVGNMLNNRCEWIHLRKLEINNNGKMNLVPVSEEEFLNGFITDSNREMQLASYRRRLNLLKGFYTIDDICKLEQCFLNAVNWMNTKDENKLFSAMEKTLLLLREIHESKGEEINYVESFKKREYSKGIDILGGHMPFPADFTIQMPRLGVYSVDIDFIITAAGN